MTAKGRGAIRIVLVEDHIVVREGTRRLLEAEPDLTVVGEAATAQEAIAEVDRLWPDVVLLDLRLAGSSSGLTSARGIVQTFPKAAIIVLTGIDDPEYARAALDAGARGYLLKTASAATIALAIRKVHGGATVLDPAIAGALRQTSPASRRSVDATLTEREAGVFQMLGRGATNAEIAAVLCLSVRTIETHVGHILDKLGLTSRAAAIAYAARELQVVSAQRGTSYVIQAAAIAYAARELQGR